MAWGKNDIFAFVFSLHYLYILYSFFVIFGSSQWLRKTSRDAYSSGRYTQCHMERGRKKGELGEGAFLQGLFPLSTIRVCAG